MYCCTVVVSTQDKGHCTDLQFTDVGKDKPSWPGAFNLTGDLWEGGRIPMNGKPCLVCHRDSLLQSVIARKELHCCVHWEGVEVLASYILREGVAWLSRTWCVRCGCDVVGTLSRA